MFERHKLLFATLVSLAITFGSILFSVNPAISANSYEVPQTAGAMVIWDDNVPSPEGYRIYKRTEEASYDYTQPCWTGSGTPANVYNLNWDKKYYFVVRAYAGELESPDSDEVSLLVASPIDTDDDGFPDAEDEFPDDPDEWLDTDKDGTGNNYDKCPWDAYDACLKERITSGQLVLYQFGEAEGTVVHDVSGTADSIDLTIDDPSAIEWIEGGGLSIVSPSLIYSSAPASKITDAVTSSGAFSIEVWVKPANIVQSGPSRIVTLSEDTSIRNFTLGQVEASYDVRFRTSDTTTNGTPSLRTDNTISTELTHVVYTRNSQGEANLYINGDLVLTQMVTGDLSDWQDYGIALGNEWTGDRPWLGEIHLTAIYDRSLSLPEVQQNFTAGPGTTNSSPKIPQTYTITTSSNENGTISPAGNIVVTHGDSQTIAITPTNGYQVEDVWIDDQSIGPVSSYLFNHIDAHHTLHVLFSPVNYLLTAAAMEGGTIIPTGSVYLPFGSTQTYSIVPDSGYRIKEVVVDGVVMGPLNSHSFTNITANHIISAGFVAIDTDGDGFPDAEDEFPDDPDEWLDTDKDGTGDNYDECPWDAYDACLKERITSGQLVLYQFGEAEGTVVHDVSGTADSIDLTIDDPSTIEWIEGGGLSIVSPALIYSSAPASKITDAVTSSGAFSIEVWVKPANIVQSGPSRIVTLSEDTSIRNFTLGQVEASYDVRFRTSDTTTNGTPSLRTDNTISTELTHVVYTRNSQGEANLYINGDLVLTQMVTGDLSDWQDYGIALGNEWTGDRPWLGEIHLTAIYDRSLSLPEVQQNFTARPDTTNSSPNTEPPLEVGKLEIDHEWSYIRFTNTYTEPIVMAGPLSSKDETPSVIRVRNINASGFEVCIQEWDYLDGAHEKETIGYLVMERGRHTMGNGYQVEAGRFHTDYTQTFVKIPFHEAFLDTPVVMSTVATVNGSDAVTGRIQGVDLNGFSYLLQNQESSTKRPIAETIHYIAWEPSAGVINNWNYEVGITGNNVTHNDFPLSLFNIVDDTAVVLGDMQTYNGSNTANVRIRQNQMDLYVRIDEEQSKDQEMIHLKENVGYVVFVEENTSTERITDGQVAVYDFTENSGAIVHDRSGFKTPIDLTIDDPSAIEWIEGGGLSIVSPALIYSSAPASKITDAVTSSGAFSIEVWVKPANTVQSGPSRIVTMSKDTLIRNFTLGQAEASYDVRFSTSETTTNGIPSLRTDNTISTELTHVVYTRNSQGEANLYINGDLVLTQMVTGDLSDWQDYGIALGNEWTGDRPWLGEIYMVAIFSRALSADEIKMNYGG